MKFNLIISNPPYTNNLDLKILKKVYELGEKVCFIHPGSWAYSKKPNMSKLYKHIKKFDVTYFKRVEDAKKLFKISIFTAICISVFEQYSKTSIKVDDIDVHGNSEIYKSLKKKILSYCHNSNLENKRTNKLYEFTFGLNWSDAGYNVMGAKNTYHRHFSNNFKGTHYPIKFGFDSKFKMEYFGNFLKLKIVRFALSIYKINQHLNRGELEAVPYMPTYDHEWTDEMVAKELGLTDEELAWAINWIPDYYPEDAVKYKNYEV